MEASYHVAIIGSGPAGPKAAIQAAKLRKRVAIIDRPTGDLDSVFVFQRCDSFEQGHLVSVQLGENHVLFVVYDVRAAGDQILHPQIPPALDSVGLQVVKAAEIQHRFPQGLVFHQESLQLLGVHAIGQGATEIIHIGQAVLFFKGTIDYFIENTFNYPTLAECYRVAALNKVMVDE